MAAEWDIQASLVSQNTSNPIRKIVDRMSVKPNPDKKPLHLSIGDPTKFGNFKCPDHMHAAIFEASKSLAFNGYGPAVGDAKARAAVAETHSYPGHPALTENDVVMASGCSQALEMCFGVLCNGSHSGGKRSNVLLPNPGFSLYQTICDAYGIEIRLYNLLPENNWCCDLKQLETLIDEDTACILVNNPSNPCGSVFPKDHLVELVRICEKHKIPIIADEIYEEMAFAPLETVSLASIEGQVPILQVGGLAKRWMAPGWRIGWICIHDRQDRFKNVRVGLADYATLILGPCAVLQGVVPAALKETPEEYYKDNLSRLQEHAEICFNECNKIDGLNPVVPQGAMYMMIQIQVDQLDIDDDVEFCKAVWAEESVHLLPGSCFGANNFFRVVICPPKDALEEAWSRIAAFMQNHLAHPAKKQKA